MCSSMLTSIPDHLRSHILLAPANGIRVPYSGLTAMDSMIIEPQRLPVSSKAASLGHHEDFVTFGLATRHTAAFYRSRLYKKLAG